MFASKKPNTVVAEGTKIVGTVTSEGLVEVNGQVDGEIHCASLNIFNKAQVAGKLVAEHITIDGHVTGPIEGGEVMLKPQAHVVGDIKCQSVIVEKGAFMEGRMMRTHKTNGRHPEERLGELAKAKFEDGLLAEAEASTRRAELAVEARHLTGNADLPADEAVAFFAKRGKAQPDAPFGDAAIAKGEDAKPAKNWRR